MRCLHAVAMEEDKQNCMYLSTEVIQTDNDIASAALSSLCVRCHSRVYPAERVSQGLCLHKTCFRCATCDVTLTLQSYVIGSDGRTLYCQSHASEHQLVAKLHPEAMNIRSAMKAQRMRNGREFNHQVLMCYLRFIFSHTLIHSLTYTRIHTHTHTHTHTHARTHAHTHTHIHTHTHTHTHINDNNTLHCV